MQKRKLTESLKKQIDELESNRNKIDEYLYNFLENYSLCSRLMHSQISKKNKKEEIKTYSYQYLSSIVTCWETYFRDLFVYLVSIDSNLKNELIEIFEINENNIQEIEIGGYLSKCFNFQNMQEIIKAFSPIFKTNIFDYAARKTYLYYFPKKNKEYLTSLIDLFPDYDTILKKGIEERHKMVHDGNFLKNIDFAPTFFQKTETVFLLFPQILTLVLSEKYNLPRLLLNKGDKNYNLLFVIEDIISEDWVIIENEA